MKYEAKKQIIRVSMGEMRVAKPPAMLTAVGIGSCVAVIIRDSVSGSGGMAHVMLPWLPQNPREGTNLLKYANYAIDKMVEQIIENGGSPDNLGAKIVGGSHMFETSKGSFPMDIGGRNLEAVRRKLSQMDIAIMAEDSGGNHGRSVELSLEDGSVLIRSVRKGEWAL